MEVYSLNKICTIKTHVFFNLITNQIHVHFLTTDSFINIEPALENYLSYIETDRINRFIFEKDRITHTVSQGMLRYILGTYLNLNPEEIIFNQNEYGKPFISEEQNPDNIQFNLSHSGDMIIYAISKGGNVGIDIQKIKDSGSIADIVDHYFSETEKAVFKSLPDEQKLKGFHSCWARKEAYIKALGPGLSYPLNSFSVPVTSEYSSAVIYDESGTAYTVTDINTSTGYAAAVAVEGSDVTYRHFELASFENNKISFKQVTYCMPVGFAPAAISPRTDIETENIHE